MSVSPQYTLWIQFFIVFSGHFTLCAQAPCPKNLLALDSLKDTYYIEKEIEILLDTGRSLSLADVQKGDAPFLPFSEHEKDLRPPFAYWGRVCIENQIDPAFAPSEWVLLFSSKLTNVEIFLSDSVNRLSLRTGEFLPIQQKDFMLSTGKNIVKVTVPPNSPRSLYFRAESEIDQPLKIVGIWMRSLEYHLKNEGKRKRVNGFFTGFFS